MTTQDDQPRHDPRVDHPQDRPTAPDTGSAPDPRTAPGAGPAPVRDAAPHDAPSGSTPPPGTSGTPATGGFNLSDWALHHRSFVWFLLVVSMIAGTLAYNRLGREEDPQFTIKTMVITAALPGATIEETVKQVTTRIETKLEELDELDFTRSVTMPGR